MTSSRPETPVLLAMGSNLGDRRTHLRQGLEFLGEQVRILQVSRVVESAPWGSVEQPSFLNLVLRGETRLTPLQLLAHAQAAENAAGRVRTVPQGPRTLDVDLIFYGQIELAHPRLTIPHPGWRERPFVHDLVGEVAGPMRDPASGRLLAQMVRRDGVSETLRDVPPLGMAGDSAQQVAAPSSGAASANGGRR